LGNGISSVVVKPT